jgi:hypothetical protein
MKGYVYAPACYSCGGTRRHEVEKKGGGVVWRCVRCSTAWPFRIEFVLRGTIETSRRENPSEAGQVDRADLALIMAQIPRGDALLYGLYLVTDRSYEYVSELASELSIAEPERWPDPRGGYTPKKVRGAVGRARRLVSELLIERGMMARAVAVHLHDGVLRELEVVEPFPPLASVPADPDRWDGLLSEVVGQAATLGHRERITLKLHRRSDGPIYTELGGAP